MLKKITPEPIKRLIWLAVQMWPYGNLCRFKYGELEVTLNKQLWIITSDGISTDALPLSFVSQQLVDRVQDELLGKWYMPTPRPDAA